MNQYYAFLHQTFWEEWSQGVELERLALKRSCAAFLVANEGEERLGEDAEDFGIENE